MGNTKYILTKSSDLSLYIKEKDWYSFSGRGYRWKIGCSKQINSIEIYDDTSK